MDMTLDDVIGADLPMSAKGSKEDHNKIRGRVRHAMEQMGLTSESSHVRRASKALAEALAEEENILHDSGRSDNRRQERPVGEQVQRWLAYVLHTGHRELGVRVEDGWAFLDELAEVMGRDRPRFGLFDSDRLRVLLEETDTIGRFELDSTGRIRKVPKDSRSGRSRGARADAQQAQAAWGAPRDAVQNA